MNKQQEVIDYIMGLKPEQVNKLVRNLDLLYKILDMTEAQTVYFETLTDLLGIGQ